MNSGVKLEGPEVPDACSAHSRRAPFVMTDSTLEGDVFWVHEVPILTTSPVTV